MNKEFDDNGQKCAVCVFICLGYLYGAIAEEREERRGISISWGGWEYDREKSRGERDREIYIYSFVFPPTPLLYPEF